MQQESQRPDTGQPAGNRLFLGFLVVAVIGLAVLNVMLTRQNATLKNELQAAAQKLERATLARGLEPGEQLDSIDLATADGAPAPLTFGDDQPPTLLLLTSAGCGACADTVPVWESVLAEGWPGLRVVCVTAGTDDPDELRSYSSAFECRSVERGRESWLRKIPLAPSAILIDGPGRVMHTWFGHMSSSQSVELQAALADVTAGASAASAN